jgi:hypothetical protein
LRPLIKGHSASPQASKFFDHNELKSTMMKVVATSLPIQLNSMKLHKLLKFIIKVLLWKMGFQEKIIKNL